MYHLCTARCSILYITRMYNRKRACPQKTTDEKKTRKPNLQRDLQMRDLATNGDFYFRIIVGQVLSWFEVPVSPSTEKKTEATTQIFCLILRNFLHESNTGSTKEQVLQHGACTGWLAMNFVSFRSSRVPHLGYREIILHSFEIQVYKAHMQKCFLSLFLFA